MIVCPTFHTAFPYRPTAATNCPRSGCTARASSPRWESCKSFTLGGQLEIWMSSKTCCLLSCFFGSLNIWQGIWHMDGIWNNEYLKVKRLKYLMESMKICIEYTLLVERFSQSKHFTLFRFTGELLKISWGDSRISWVGSTMSSWVPVLLLPQ